MATQGALNIMAKVAFVPQWADGKQDVDVQVQVWLDVISRFSQHRG